MAISQSVLASGLLRPIGSHIIVLAIELRDGVNSSSRRSVLSRLGPISFTGEDNKTGLPLEDSFEVTEKRSKEWHRLGVGNVQRCSDCPRVFF